jgi:hypothetical protein
MLYPVRVLDKDGKLKKIIEVSDLYKDYWKKITTNGKGFTSFGKGKPDEFTPEHKKNKIQV